MKPDPEYLDALRRGGRSRGYFRTRPDRWPVPPREHRASPLEPDGSVYPGPPAMPGWEPVAEDQLRDLERQAFAVLLRLGHLEPGDLVPWRGERAALIGSLLRHLPDPSEDAGGLAAVSSLVAVERAAERDPEAFAAALASTIAGAALIDAGRAAAQQLAAAKRGGAANRSARHGRPPTVAPAMLAKLRLEASEIRSAHPKWGERAVARELAKRCARSSESERARVAALSEQRLAELLRV